MVDGRTPPNTICPVTAPLRPSLTHARRTRRIMGAVAAAGALVVGVFALTGGLPLGSSDPGRSAPSGPAPWDYSVAAWTDALGGDEGLTQADYQELAAYADPDLKSEIAPVRALAEQVARADLTGQGQGPVTELTPTGVTPYWPAPSPTGAPVQPQCSEVSILASSPTTLPVSGADTATLGLFEDFTKTLVAYAGTCGDVTYSEQDPGVTFVFAGRNDSGWVPLRYWQVPADAGFDTLPGATEPYDWELKEVTGTCAPQSIVRARIAVVDAFTAMCDAAAEQGVTLDVISGYRTRTEQAAMFADAVSAYGSVDAARQRVAYADKDVCTSRHCSGLAINVSEADPAIGWLSATAGCVSADGTTVAATECTSDQTPIANAARWGFVVPLAVSPGYLEFTLPIGADGSSSLGTPNCSPTGISAANQVASIFRCRLARAGVVGVEQERVVAEALTVSRCESGWNATAAAFGGRFATTPNPRTGLTYTHRGIFMLTQDQANAGWVVGGSDALTDPIANINAAASLWLTTHGWEQFGCATGAATDGFELGPVLPQYGGPALPDWSHLY